MDSVFVISLGVSIQEIPCLMSGIQIRQVGDDHTNWFNTKKKKGPHEENFQFSATENMNEFV